MSPPNLFQLTLGRWGTFFTVTARCSLGNRRPLSVWLTTKVPSVIRGRLLWAGKVQIWQEKKFNVQRDRLLAEEVYLYSIEDCD